MLVKATARGFYGGRIREIGDEFEVKDGEKASWFVSVQPVDLKKPEPKAAKKPEADVI